MNRRRRHVLSEKMINPFVKDKIYSTADPQRERKVNRIVVAKFTHKAMNNVDFIHATGDLGIHCVHNANIEKCSQ